MVCSLNAEHFSTQKLGGKKFFFFVISAITFRFTVAGACDYAKDETNYVYYGTEILV